MSQAQFIAAGSAVAVTALSGPLRIDQLPPIGRLAAGALAAWFFRGQKGILGAALKGAAVGMAVDAALELVL